MSVMSRILLGREPAPLPPVRFGDPDSLVKKPPTPRPPK